MCAARSATAETLPRLLEEVETRRRTSLIAVFYSSASFSSLVSRATSGSWLAADEPTGRTVQLRRFTGGLRRRSLTDPARLIAFPRAQDKAS